MPNQVFSCPFYYKINKCHNKFNDAINLTIFFLQLLADYDWYILQ